MAVRRSATSPMVGPVRNEATPFTPPSSADADTVPARIAAPPEMTVMNALAM